MVQTMEEYAEAIFEQWASHAKMADELAEIGDFYNQGYHAFMANAISCAVARSSNTTLKALFVERDL